MTFKSALHPTRASVKIRAPSGNRVLPASTVHVRKTRPRVNLCKVRWLCAEVVCPPANSSTSASLWLLPPASIRPDVPKKPPVICLNHYFPIAHDAISNYHEVYRASGWSRPTFGLPFQLHWTLSSLHTGKITPSQIPYLLPLA